MKEFLSFIKEYYYLLVLVLVFIVMVLEIVLSKRKIANPSILAAIDKMLPDLINEAEKQFPNAQSGASKLNFCILTAQDSLSKLFDIKDFKTYENYIKKHIENILSCPQKKGV